MNSANCRMSHVRGESCALVQVIGQYWEVVLRRRRHETGFRGEGIKRNKEEGGITWHSSTIREGDFNLKDRRYALNVIVQC